MPPELPVTVYSADSTLASPRVLWRAMQHDLIASRGLAWRLFVRDLSAQYRQSLLGYVWAFLPPLVASLPFIFLESQGIISVAETAIPYGAFAMTGTIIWQVFVDAWSSPLRTVVAARSMLTRINFPREALLLASVAQVLFSFVIRLALLVGVFVWFGLTPPLTAMLFPLGMLGVVLVGFSIGLILTPVGLLFGDIQHAIPLAATFLMFLTPVLYPPPTEGVGAILAQWNPISPLIVVSRDWLTVGATTHLLGFLGVVSVAWLFLLGGWACYRIALPHVVARLGN